MRVGTASQSPRPDNILIFEFPAQPIPILARVGLISAIGLPLTSVENVEHSPHIVGTQTTIYAGWAGSQSPRAEICIDLEFQALLIPVYLPSAPADFRGRWGALPHKFLGCI